jgi:restriction system protein
MLPLLEVLADGRERTAAECRETLASRFSLTPEDLEARLRSGVNVFADRVHWTATYLVKAGLLVRPRRGALQITERGIELLAEPPERIDVAFLANRYEEFRAWQRASRQAVENTSPGGPATAPSALSPEEALVSSYEQIRESVEADLLDRVRSVSPDRFEKLVLDLLLKLGYGGAFGSGIHLGRSGDGGIDGVIQQDKLGLDLIYVQAKRWQGNVGPSTVREFAGALSAHRADKGVIITTSSFTAEAKKDAERMAGRIALIDGAQLASLMYEFDLGVSVVSTFVVKRPDSDYFETPD